MKRKTLLCFGACLLLAAQATAQSLAEQLAGNWEFTASNNGKIVNGVYSAGTDTFPFTATIGSDGQSLECHADCLYKSATNVAYPATWRIVVEENDEGQFRLGWVLSKEQPTFTQEFNEPQSSYLDEGLWYFGTGTEEHHYIYLLTENEDMTAYVAGTFWSEWSTTGTQDFSLKCPEFNSQKFYAFVSNGIPYDKTIGAIEIWASPKIKKTTDAGIHTTADGARSATDSPVFDLQGRQLSAHTQPQRGLYIRNGKKYMLK